MMQVPYYPERNFDPMLDNILNAIKKALVEKNDDFLLLHVGSTGTGKTSLSLHEIEYLRKDDLGQINNIGLDIKDFASALKKATHDEHPKICCYDEANVSKRRTQSTFNNDLIDLYFSIRGLNIFHIWNNPSLDILDKTFIEERVKGLIFIVSKDVNRPRLYYYFRKDDLLKLWDKYVVQKKLKMSLRLLKKVAKNYAYYRGWFKDYKGILLDAYKVKKASRMKDKVQDFFEKYGEMDNGFITKSDLAKELGVVPQTIDNYVRELLEKQKIEPIDVTYSSHGSKIFRVELIDVFKSLKEERKQREMGNLRHNRGGVSV